MNQVTRRDDRSQGDRCSSITAGRACRHMPSSTLRRAPARRAARGRWRSSASCAGSAGRSSSRPGSGRLFYILTNESMDSRWVCILSCDASALTMPSAGRRQGCCSADR